MELLVIFLLFWGGLVLWDGLKNGGESYHYYECPECGHPEYKHSNSCVKVE